MSFPVDIDREIAEREALRLEKAVRSFELVYPDWVEAEERAAEREEVAR